MKVECSKEINLFANELFLYENDVVANFANFTSGVNLLVKQRVL
jgi:hypothetical protein